MGKLALADPYPDLTTISKLSKDFVFIQTILYLFMIIAHEDQKHLKSQNIF